MSEDAPSPADAARLTADELVAKIRQHGGRLYRTKTPPNVFVLTSNPLLVRTLVKLDPTQRPILRGNDPPEIQLPNRSYLRTRDGVREWDLYVHSIPTKGEKTIWEACA